MPLGTPPAGFSFSPEYQSAALPWVTSSLATSGSAEIDFPFITRFIAITNSSTSSLSLAFSLNGSNGNNKILIPGNTYVNLEYRVASVWIRAEASGSLQYSIAAGLTTIPANSMPSLSGSAGWSGVG